jgi:hypothetical protein
VEQLPLEVLQPFYSGKRRAVERPEATYDEARAQRGHASDLDLPPLGVGIPDGAGDVGVEAQVLANPEAVGAVLHVVADLTAAGVHVRPVRIGSERERVQRRRDVAGAPRVVVVAPGAAERRTSLQHHEVLPPRAPQSDRHPQTGEA